LFFANTLLISLCFPVLRVTLYSNLFNLLNLFITSFSFLSVTTLLKALKTIGCETVTMYSYS